MHILTKFLVVFAAVLSVLLAGLSIAYTSNADRIVSEFNVERDRATKSEGQAAAVQAASAVERESLQKKIADLESSLQSSTDSMASIQGENARLLTEVNALKQASVTHSAQIDQFTAVVQTYATLNKSQADELQKLRERELEFNKKEIELSDRINDLQGELEVSRETNRSLQEQLVATREQMDRVQQGGPAASGSAGGYLRAPLGFRSRITGVRKDETGSTLVSLTGGSNDALKPGMRLNIVRDQFLATLILERVDQSESIGRVDFLGRQGQVEIRTGDLVIPTL